MMLAALILPFSGKAVHAQRPAISLAPQSAELMAGARLRIPGQPLLSSGQIGPNLHQVAARPSKRTGETLMIVGSAVFLAGLLADEAIISIAGVAIGGYGLYVYLDASPKRR
ncbi:MAG TPA: hypothetical protein VFU40_09335, partial [Gemmatimonadales bacterium]|nr:hypothetical protein [Gemmatimonadales bacterium]